MIQDKFYTWGYNKFGQLGYGDRVSSFIPKIVGALNHEKIIKVIAGDYISAALTQEGQLYTWGCNKTGELGQGSHEDETLPKKVIFDHHINHLAASGAYGYSHVFAQTDVMNWSQKK